MPGWPTARACRVVPPAGSFVLLVYASLLFHPYGVSKPTWGYAYVHTALICRPGAGEERTANGSALAPWYQPRERAEGSGACGGTDGLLTSSLILAFAAMIGWARLISMSASTTKRFGPFIVIMVRHHVVIMCM